MTSPASTAHDFSTGEPASSKTNPFALSNDSAYAAWREQKLAGYPKRVEDLVVSVANPAVLTGAECEAIRDRIGRANMAVYVSPQSEKGAAPDTAMVAAMGRHFGLQHLDQNLYADDDGISALQVSEQPRQHEYIPYSTRPISWHTDGYYNPPERKVRAMVLHCARPAAEGGENALLDHEMVYLQLRDANPGHIAALMQADAMTIPANIENGVEIRPAQSGPVFSVDFDESGPHLHMRYTARTRSIEWKQDAQTQAAVKVLEAILAGNSPYCFHKRLDAGEGLISNNVLHTRTGFVDADNGQPGRLMFRARYYDRIK